MVPVTSIPNAFNGYVNMSQSELLTRFYRAVAEQLDRDTPDAIFHEDTGLCGNLRHWGARILNLSQEKVTALVQEMEQQFRDAELNAMFPFNPVEGSYCDEEEAGTLYDNINRIQWIRDHAK